MDGARAEGWAAEMMGSKAIATILLCGLVAGACGSGSSGKSDGAGSSPAGATAAAAGIGDTFAAGGFTVKVTAVAHGPYAMNTLWPDSASTKFSAAKGSLVFGEKGWVVQHLETSTAVLGVRASVTGGIPYNAAKLAVTVRDAGGEYATVATLSRDDQNLVIWLFELGASASSAGPYTLVFPSGQTVSLGTAAASQ